MRAEIVENSSVVELINTYPEGAALKLLEIRAHIFSLCAELEHVGTLTETFKWGEPSYVSDVGSTIRMAWKKEAPETYSLYFVCTTKLVDTFRELYSEVFKFSGNREIIFEMNVDYPTAPLRHCLGLALCYKKVKTLPLLGA